MVISQLLVLGNFKQKMYQTSVYLYRRNVRFT